MTTQYRRAADPVLPPDRCVAVGQMPAGRPLAVAVVLKIGVLGNEKWAQDDHDREGAAQQAGEGQDEDSPE
jgi:hypothetical protein